MRRRSVWSVFPQPPRPRQATDFVVVVLVVTVATGLLLSILLLAVGEWLHPTKDHTAAVAGISNTFQTIVGALVGYVAGKNTRHRPDTQESDDDPDS